MNVMIPDEDSLPFILRIAIHDAIWDSSESLLFKRPRLRIVSINSKQIADHASRTHNPSFIITNEVNLRQLQPTFNMYGGANFILSLQKSSSERGFPQCMNVPQSESSAIHCRMSNYSKERSKEDVCVLLHRFIYIYSQGHT